jgi:hypothetical protein
MGAWGVGVRDDDFVRDVEGLFEDCLKDGGTVEEATSRVHQRFGGASDDEEDGPLYWIAVADMQWTYGRVQPAVLSRVTEIVEGNLGMERWGEPTETAYQQRRTVLREFLGKISAPNPKPARPPKRIVRKPKFQAGDCLSIRLEDGRYGAGLVLATDHSEPEQGMDLVGDLDYLADAPPSLDVFEGRSWLRPTHPGWDDELSVMWYYPIGFRKMKPRIAVVGSVALRPDDPKDSSVFVGWQVLGRQVLRQHEWDAREDA